MKPSGRLLVLVAGLAAGALLLALLPSSWLFRPPPLQEAAGVGDARQYACPMFCTMADAPGDCPVCGMEMEPVTDHGAQVRLGPRERYMAGIRTAPVERRAAVHRVRALGKIRYDQRREGQVTAWVSGRLDDLFVDFEGIEIERGEKIAEIYAPELVTAQEELISARQAWQEAREANGDVGEDLALNARRLYEAAPRRLLLLGMPEALVDAIETSGEVRDNLEILANVGGTVVRKAVEKGDYVKTGQVLYEVVDLDVVWAMLDVFEQDAGAVRLGQRVEIRVPSLPGHVRYGVVAFVDPVLDERRRVLRVRVDLPNAEGLLKPGMFVDGEILARLTDEGRVADPTGGAEAGRPLLVPRSAVLQGAERQLAYVMTQPPGPEVDGRERWPAIYEPREVRTGFRVGDDLVVLEGLEDGDRVVVRGQFLLDSQLQLTGKPSLLVPEAAGGIPADPHAGH